MTLSLILFSVLGQGQIRKYVQEQAVQIATIEPDSTNYADLEVIGNAIGNAKVVMLGEQDHGDAPGYQAKTRLIKYLHEKKDFNVVAFEDDFFTVNYNWKLVKERKLNIDSFIKRNISITWSSCGVSSPLFKDYIPSTLKTNHPLEISGFDNETATLKTLPLLDSVLRTLKIPITQSLEYSSEIIPLLATWYKYTVDTLTTDKIIEYYRDIKAQMLVKLSKDDFWVITVDNLIQQNIRYRNWKKDWLKNRNTRDRQMAINLKWLSETKYPDEKIIVWTHNYHASKYSGHFFKEFINKVNTMGSIFTEDTAVMRETYIIGFTSYQGTAGRTFEKKYKVQKPKSNSFENWINKDYNYAFVDFKMYNNLYPASMENFYVKGSMGAPFHRNEKAQWTKVFDGIIYIKETYPCEK